MKEVPPKEVIEAIYHNFASTVPLFDSILRILGKVDLISKPIPTSEEPGTFISIQQSIEKDRDINKTLIAMVSRQEYAALQKIYSMYVLTHTRWGKAYFVGMLLKNKRMMGEALNNLGRKNEAQKLE